MRTIGILGGMGPEATILLQSRLLNAVDAQDDVDHLPLLVSMNPQVPSRLDWILENKGINPGPVLAQMALSLQQGGADALAMPCNTAHHFAPEIEQATEIPFFNMPQLAAKTVAEVVGEEEGSIGVLASPSNQVTGLFDQTLGLHGYRAVFPVNQAIMLEAIRAIKANGLKDSTIRTLQHESDKLVSKGVKCILIACSEFSLLTESIHAKVPLIDTLDVLVDHLVTFSGARKKG